MQKLRHNNISLSVLEYLPGFDVLFTNTGIPGKLEGFIKTMLAITQMQKLRHNNISLSVSEFLLH